MEDVNVAGEWGDPVEHPEIQFGEQGARLTYGSYLQLDRLLSAQRLESQPPAHDELLFITIHQVYELWFQQLLHEATAVRDAMLSAPLRGSGRAGDRLWWAQHLLARMHVIERVLVQQVTEAERSRLLRRLDEPSLWDAFLRVLDSRGLPVDDDDQVTASVRRVAHDRSTYADVWAVAEGLLQHDELAASWRSRHVVMVERMIGTRTGTGGSSGADYLRSRLDLRYYPLLWELRSVL